MNITKFNKAELLFNDSERFEDFKTLEELYNDDEKGTVYNSFWVDPKYLAIDRKIRSSFSIQPNSDLTDILPLLSYFKIPNTDIEALLASHDKHLISKHIKDTVIEDKPVRRL